MKKVLFLIFIALFISFEAIGRSLYGPGAFAPSIRPRPYNLSSGFPTVPMPIEEEELSGEDYLDSYAQDIGGY